MRSIAVVDPTSGIIVGCVAAGTAADVDRAVKAARRAFDAGAWRKMRGADRERLLLRLAELLEANATEFSEIESVNSGRILPATRAFDVDLSVSYLRYMAGWATKIHGQTLEASVPYVPGGRFFAMTLRQPVGVVGAITPWNVPAGTGPSGRLRRPWRPDAPSSSNPRSRLRSPRCALPASLPRPVFRTA